MAKRWLILVLAAVLGAVGCSGRAPLKTLRYDAAPPGDRGLIIFLQGLGGTTGCFTAGHKCFEAQGFVEAVRARGLPYDMVAPNAHFGYYMDRTLHERLRADIIGPARARGYTRIWLVGVSMGGLGSILHLQKHPEDVSGILALGPFLGYDAILDEISAAGGVAQWQPGPFDPQKDWQRAMWQWLKQLGEQPAAAPVFLGFGTRDAYARGHKLMAAILPPERALIVDGGHRFKTFRRIWEMFLDQGHLDR